MTNDKTISKGEMGDLYRKRAKRYDYTIHLYRLIGLNIRRYQKNAVKALDLQRGDVVVEVGCGTGLNFSLLRQSIGPEGKVIGIDLNEAMLAMARGRAEKNGWKNIELLRTDAASFVFPPGVGGIISTFALTLIPEFDKIVRHSSEALLPGRLCVILEPKVPSNRLAMLAPLLVALSRPYGVSLEMTKRHPWESMEKYFNTTSVTQFYGGFVYIATGKK